MGIFAGYFGEPHVPQERLDELTRRVVTVAQQGGMMDLERVELFGKRIYTIDPAKLDKEGILSYRYNYFEDDVWEGASYDSNNGEAWSNKVSGAEFGLIVQAVYTLIEFYSDSFAIAHWDGVIHDNTEIIGWLNALFDAQYTNQRMHDLWRVYAAMDDDYDRKRNDLIKLIDPGGFGSLSWRGFANYLFVSGSPYAEGILEAMAEAEEEVEDAAEAIIRARETGIRKGPTITIPLCIKTLTSSVAKIKQKEGGSDEEKLKILKDILNTKVGEKIRVHPDRDFYVAAFVSAFLTPEIAAKIITDAFDVDFWEFYSEIKDTCQYIPDFWTRESAPLAPMEKVSTSEFLKGPYTCDDDRAYFWKPDGDVKLSKQMKRWLRELCGELDSIEAAEGTLIEPVDFAQELISTLHEIDRAYYQVMPFKSMFYDFISRAAERRVQASVILLQRLAERLQAELPPEQERHTGWPDRLNWIHCMGRRKMKRILAVMGNFELRKETLGF